MYATTTDYRYVVQAGPLECFFRAGKGQGRSGINYAKWLN
jgi:hypothetical protein